MRARPYSLRSLRCSANSAVTRKHQQATLLRRFSLLFASDYVLLGSNGPDEPLIGRESQFMIELRNVSKSYDGASGFCVQGVNLRVPKGTLLVLLGASGSG